ncbi:hypothetical protein [Paenibacillus brevis]|uniref:Uncharacterized protein n=1 Tax=Paenibacillus brevis TaxID=2841508 RepID=A0ABS6FRI3_9BACL|nr:hypothetical protein [Paenibacillus brevis]MBU5672734.1 hypothetical protein [Paenibacillus brevis]
MKSSSFLCGALFGMAAVVWASKRKSWAGMLTEAGSYIKMPSSGKDCHSHAHKHDGAKAESKANSTGAAATAQVPPSPSAQSHENHSKEYNLKQLKELIKGSAEVRREVEAILKESHTAVPGL